MNYQEKIEKATRSIDDADCNEWTEGTWAVEDGFMIRCIHYFGQEVLGSFSIDKCFVLVEEETDILTFHYGGYGYEMEDESINPVDEWSFTLSTFNEVGQWVQPYYQSWLDQNGFTLEAKELDESPWLVNVIKRKED